MSSSPSSSPSSCTGCEPNPPAVESLTLEEQRSRGGEGGKGEGEMISLDTTDQE